MAASLKLIQEGKDKAMDRQKALEAALAQIDRAFGKGSAMKLGSKETMQVETISTGIARARYRARRRRPAARPGDRDLRAGKLGQDHARAARDRRGAEGRRHRGLRRCRTCARSGLCQEAGRQHRRADRLAARYRRAGARDRRHAGALERDRRAGGRFGRRAGAARRNRGRDGRQPRRPAGAADVADRCAS